MNNSILATITSLSLVVGGYNLTEEESLHLVEGSERTISEFNVGLLNRLVTVARFEHIPLKANTASAAYQQLVDSGLIHNSVNSELLYQLDTKILFEQGRSWADSRFVLFNSDANNTANFIE